MSRSVLLLLLLGLCKSLLTIRLQVHEFDRSQLFNYSPQPVPCFTELDRVLYRGQVLSSHNDNSNLLDKPNLLVKFQRAHIPQVKWFDYDWSPPDGERLGVISLEASAVDPTFLRQKLVADMSLATGVASPRVSHAELYLNSDYLGLYCVVEVVDHDFLVRHELALANAPTSLYKANQASWETPPKLYPGGPMEKLVHGGGGETHDRSAPTAIPGHNQQSGRSVAGHLTSHQDANDLYQLYEQLQTASSSPPQHAAWKQLSLSVEDWVLYSAVNALSFNTLAFSTNYHIFASSNHSTNTSQSHLPPSPGGSVFRLVGAGSPASWGLAASGAATDAADAQLFGTRQPHLASTLMQMSQYRARYLNTLSSLLLPSSCFGLRYLHKWVDREAAQLAEAVARDLALRSSSNLSAAFASPSPTPNAQGEDVVKEEQVVRFAVNALKSAIEQRVSAVRSAVAAAVAGDSSKVRQPDYSEARYVRFLSPAGGQVLEMDRQFVLQWRAAAVGHFRLYIQAATTGEQVPLLLHPVRNLDGAGATTVTVPDKLGAGQFRVVATDSWCQQSWSSAVFLVSPAKDDRKWYREVFEVYGRTSAVNASFAAEPRLASAALRPSTTTLLDCAVKCLAEDLCVAVAYVHHVQGCMSIYAFRSAGSLAGQRALVQLADLPVQTSPSTEVLIKKQPEEGCGPARPNTTATGCHPLQQCKRGMCTPCPPGFSTVNRTLCVLQQADLFDPLRGQGEQKVAVEEVTKGCSCPVVSPEEEDTSAVCVGSVQYKSACYAFCNKQTGPLVLPGKCLTCSPGMVPKADNSGCQVCPANTYARFAGSTVCSRCLPTLVSDPGSSACKSVCPCRMGAEDGSVCAGGLSFPSACKATCHGHLQYQGGPCRQSGLLRVSGGLCLDAVAIRPDQRAQMRVCDSGRTELRWVFDQPTALLYTEKLGGQDLTTGGGLCLSAPRFTEPNSTVVLASCNPEDPSQQWAFEPATGTFKVKQGLCLHARERVQPGGAAVVWQCGQSFPGQRWSMYQTAAAAVNAEPLVTANIPAGIPSVGQLSLAASSLCVSPGLPYTANVLVFQDLLTTQSSFNIGPLLTSRKITAPEPGAAPGSVPYPEQKVVVTDTNSAIRGSNQNIAFASAPAQSAEEGLLLFPCVTARTAQHWSFDWRTQQLLHSSGRCLQAEPPSTVGSYGLSYAEEGVLLEARVRLVECSTVPRQQWEFDPIAGTLTMPFPATQDRIALRLCLHAVSVSAPGFPVVLRECLANAPVNQQWLMASRSLSTQQIIESALPLARCPNHISQERLCCSEKCWLDPEAQVEATPATTDRLGLMACLPGESSNDRRTTAAGQLCTYFLTAADVQQCVGFEEAVKGVFIVCSDRSRYSTDYFGDLRLISANGQHGTVNQSFSAVRSKLEDAKDVKFAETTSGSSGSSITSDSLGNLQNNPEPLSYNVPPGFEISTSRSSDVTYDMLPGFGSVNRDSSSDEDTATSPVAVNYAVPPGFSVPSDTPTVQEQATLAASCSELNGDEPCQPGTYKAKEYTRFEDVFCTSQVASRIAALGEVSVETCQQECDSRYSCKALQFEAGSVCWLLRSCGSRDFSLAGSFVYIAQQTEWFQHNGVWSDTDCPSLPGGTVFGQTLGACQSLCEKRAKDNCSAFNFAPAVGVCTLKACSLGALPSVPYSQYNGYAIYPKRVVPTAKGAVLVAPVKPRPTSSVQPAKKTKQPTYRKPSSSVSAVAASTTETTPLLSPTALPSSTRTTPLGDAASIPPPRDLVLHSITTTTITVVWAPPVDDVDEAGANTCNLYSFSIAYRKIPQRPEHNSPLVWSTTGKDAEQYHTIRGLAPGHLYEVEVFSVDSRGRKSLAVSCVAATRSTRAKLG